MISKAISYYEIFEEIGSGRMGKVYRALDTNHDCEVALRVLLMDLVSDPACLEHFDREAEAIALLNHPNIIALSTIKEAEGVRFLTMELVQGQSLDQIIPHSKLPVLKVLDIGIAVADALQAAHGAGIVHRDLTPANLMLSTDGQVKVLDFGLARLADETMSAQPEQSATGSARGTVPYMSPEQARGQAIDTRTDLFSAGAVLYEAATGRQCFSGATSTAIFDAILNQDPTPPRELDSQLSPALEQILVKALEKDRDLRYQGAADFQADFKRARRDLESSQIVLPLDREGEGTTAIDSLVVLPFINNSGDSSIEYFSEGITESIINNLAQLPGLLVVSRSTAFRYGARHDSPRAIASELGVRAVVIGRVTKQGDNLSIKTELVDATSDSQLWGAHYNRKSEDVFAVEQDIANEISRKLKLNLTRAEKSRLARRHTDSTDAYEHYLHGRFYWNRRSVEGLKKSITHFSQAIEKDSSYALAYSGMADAYHILGYYNAIPSMESWKGAKAAAQSALAIDASLAEVHTSVAAVAAAFEWDWVSAQREYELAMEINPHYATTYHWYAFCLLMLNRFEDAIESIQQARELDPLSLIFNTDLGWCYYYAGDYDRAIAQYKLTLELADFVPARYSLAQAYVQKGQFYSGIAMLKRLQDPSYLGELGYAHAVAGQEDEAKNILSRMKSFAGDQYAAPSQLAAIYAGLGEKDQAFELLEQAYEERNPIMAYIRAEPCFDPLRDDPRYEQLVRRMNFPE